MRKSSSLFLSLILLTSQSLTVLSQVQKQPPANPAQPQQGEASSPYDDEVVRITTNLVQVDAVVMDKDGRYVTDLRPEDFEISEDGKKQEITNFSYIKVDPASSRTPDSNRTARAEKSASIIPPVRLKPEQLRRTIALVVDDLSLSVESIVHVKKSLKNYLDAQIQDNDLSAILRTSSGVGVLQQFTTDKRILNAAVDRIRWYPLSRGGLNALEPKSALGEQPAARGDVDASKMGTSEENREANSIGDSIDALMYIVRGLQRLPGRKAIVLFTDGLRLFDRVDNALNSNVQRLRRLVDLANRSSVVFYSIDARGLQPLSFTAGDKATTALSSQNAAAMVGVGSPRQNFFEDQDGMNYLAKETGGIFMQNNNDFNKAVGRVLEDQKGYYLLGYRPDVSTFDPLTGRRTFHNLKVKIKPSGLTVRSRTGFYGVAEPKATEQPRTREQQLMAALTSPFSASGVDMRMTSLFSNDARRGSFMRSLIYINGNDLQFSEEADGSRKARVDIAAVTFNGEGRVVDQIIETREVRVTASGYRSILRNGLTYTLDVPVNKQSGGYQLRAAVRDAATEKLGSANQFISVPDLSTGHLAVSGISIAGVTPGRNSSEVSAGQGNQSATAEYDSLFGPAVRRLKQGMILDYGYVIYNALLDKSTGKPQVTTQVRFFRDGKLIFTGKVAPLDTSNQKDLRRLIAGGSIQTGADMLPGDYVLQIIVTDPLAKEKYRVTTQWIDFEIIK